MLIEWMSGQRFIIWVAEARNQTTFEYSHSSFFFGTALPTTGEIEERASSIVNES